MYVIGTAGHVDHGKSALVKALTGIDPDRLPEEKDRGMTIDLGFAWLKLPDGEEVGIVDVPGHERFIRNMIAGVGGIDFVVLVIAADDGWMPQTEEHLQIINFLGVRHGLVVLTKIDLVKREWLELVEDDIRTKLNKTFLEEAPVVKTSVVTKEGLKQLISQLAECLKVVPPRPDLEKPRLYFDRVFTLAGRGTIVTGTLIDGHLQAGQEVLILPGDRYARIRSLQTHKKEITEAVPGSRVAINLSGIEKEEISRGDMLTLPEIDLSSDFVSCRIESVPNTRSLLSHGGNYLVLLGTSEVQGKLLLLEGKRVPPGESGYAVLKLKHKIPCLIGDRFIIRLPSPATTLGGGTVLEIEKQRYSRNRENLLQWLSERFPPDAEKLIVSEVKKRGVASVKVLSKNARLHHREIAETATLLADDGKLVRLGDLYGDPAHIDEIERQTIDSLQKEHRERPHLPGIKVAEFVSRYRLEASLAEKLLSHFESRGKISRQGAFLRLSAFAPQLTEEQKEIADKLLKSIASSPLANPTREELLKIHPGGFEVLKFLIAHGEVVEFRGGILLTTKDFEEVKKTVLEHLREKGKATAGELRKLLNTSRKYMIPVLEKLDELKITAREGDYRKLRD
ncbi:MAG: selenocysteine-specific translation elongation factor [Candidatus Zixiibacteriota bacterium]